MKKGNLVLILLIFSAICYAQSSSENIDFSSDKWKIFGAAKVKNTDSQQVIQVSEGTGIAYLDGIDFKNGVIECDLFSPNDKAYLGIVFRISSLNNFEYIYFQPHTSNKWDAVQYDPIFNRSATWQIYHGESYQAPADIPTREWFHVKIEIMDDSAKVFLGDDPKHVLSVKLQHDISSGAIGVCSYHPANFKNFTFTKTDTNVENEKRSIAITQNSTYITNWLISAPYDNYDYKIEKPLIHDSLAQKWIAVQAEENHAINLNRYFTLTPSRNTVLAKVKIESNKKQTKKLYFGYSDKIKIYLNSEFLFTGDNSFVESDRYEDRGYINDDQNVIELPLQKGSNELIFEISEKKFGWGYIAKFENLDNIKIVNLSKTQ